MQLDISFIIEFHFYNFITIIVTCLYIEYRENKSVSRFSTIFISIIDYIYLALNNYVENIKFFIQFHFVRNFVRRFFYRRVRKVIQGFTKLHEKFISWDVKIANNIKT